MSKGAYAMLAAAALTLVLAFGKSSAHHSAGVFDPVKIVSVTGVVTDFQFVNPHVLVFVKVENDDGTEEIWGGEMTAPNRLQRMSNLPIRWTRDILKPGDEITMEGHPARNGAPGMDVVTIINPEGTAIIGGGEDRGPLNTN